MKAINSAMRPILGRVLAERELWDSKELLRRQAWVQRQRRAGRSVTLIDAPPPSQRCSAEDWLEPCPACGCFQWDIHPRHGTTYCAPCAGVTLPLKEREKCRHLRRKWRRGTA